MAELKMIIRDPENNRFFHLSEKGISAYRLSQDEPKYSVEKVWHFYSLSNPFGIEYFKGHVYAADNKRLFKFSAEDGKIILANDSHGFIPMNDPSMFIMKDLIFLINNPGSVKVYGIDDLMQICSYSAGYE